MRDSGRPEDAGTAKPEDAGTEATRETISRRQGKKDSGQPESLNPRQSRKVQYAGQLAIALGGATGSAVLRGNPKRQHQRRRRTRDSGQLEDPSPAQPEDAGTGVTRGLISRRNQKLSCGATRSLSAGCVEGCEIRGNSKIHRRQGRKMQKPGEPGDSSRGATGRAELRGDLKLERQKC